MGRPPPRDLVTGLREARSSEQALLQRWRGEPASEYEDWTGDARDEGAPAPVGGGELVVTDDGDVPIGIVSWRAVSYGPGARSQALDIGISLRPQGRGQGHGSRAQRLLADHLFATTTVHRVQASTDTANEAECAALSRAGFTAEGVLRGAQWRAGGHRDLVSYARLRDDG